MRPRVLRTTFSKIALGLCLWCAGVPAQVITTVAGTDFVFPASPLPALNAPLGNIEGVAVDAQGNAYVADFRNNLVVRISPDGVLTVVAGNGIEGFSGDGGPATSASLFWPQGVAVDSAGNLYIADSANGRIRKVTGGTITTVAGGGNGPLGDGGPATSASLSLPQGVALDSAGNLYIADWGNNRIRKVSGGTITTVAGGGNGPLGDGGPATSASLDLPSGVAVDSAGNLYIADWLNYRIRKVSGGTITTVAGSGSFGLLGDGGPATNASLGLPAGVAVDSAGNLYIADTLDNRIRKVSGGTITTVAGNGNDGYSGDGGSATSASLYWPYGVAVDSAGNLYIADSQNNRIRKVSGGTITTVAGNGAYRYSGDGGSATSAALNGPYGAAVDSFGSLYIADYLNNRVRKVSGGTITTVAGNGYQGFSGDGGPATSASMTWPSGVAVDSAGNLYIAEPGDFRIRKVSGGTITTVAGNGDVGFSGDGGPATRAELYQPEGVAVDSAGNFYIADTESNCIRKVSGGKITTVAGIGNGIGGKGSFSGDGGPATSASLDGPYGVAVDSAGNLYIADTGNNRIREVSGGTITTVAGGGNGPLGDGGPATSASLSQPEGVAVDPAGNLYIADTQNNRIRKVSGGTITTVAGNGNDDFSGDGGPATSASLSWPIGAAVDAAGNLYIVDWGNNRIREVLATKPAVLVSTASLTFNGQATGAPAPTQSFSIASVPGLGFSLTVATTGGNWLSVTPPSGAVPRLINVVADPSALTSPGAYQGTITIATPDGNPPATTVNVTFQVSAAQPAALALDSQNISFSFAKSSPAQSQRLTISNSGGSTLAFTAKISVASPAGGAWLSVSPASGEATPAAPVTLTVTADPTGLSPGTYTATVTVTGAGSAVSVPVTMTISPLNQVILLTQRGLSFTAVAQGGVVPPQTFAVRNIGTGVVPWTVSTSTLSGGQGWLQVTPASGSSDAAQNPAAVTVSVNAAGVAAGIYYGLVQVNAPAAANSPQVVTVFLQVLSAGSDAAAVVDQGAMLFTAVTGGESPGSQTVSVYNITASVKSFRSAVSADPGLNLVTLPTDATLDPQNPTRIVVQPFTSGLASGVYNATVTLQFSDGRVLRVNVKVIVSSTGGGSGPSPAAVQRGTMAGPLDASTCMPTKLVPALISLADSFELPTGLPVNLGVYVRDDCGTPVESGSVTATFSTGGSAPLLPANGGLWQGQWLTQNGALSTATVTLHAVNGNLTGDQQVTGNLLALEQPPAFEQNGIAAVFGGSANAPIAPGSVIAIYGSQLAADTGATTGSPLPGSWLGTQAFISGGSNVLLALPLYYVSPGQVNAIVPYEVQTNVPLQLLVERGSAASQPVSVNVAAAGPALYGGPGAVTDYPASGAAPYTVTASAPAHAGDALVIYCLGLGAVNPPVTDGGVPTGLSQVTGAQVQIGAQTAQPFFEGLSQFPGLYQINVVIPAGTGTGSAVPLVVTIGGQASQPITVAIQ